LQIRRPDGKVIPLDESQRTFTQTDLPGIYTIDSPPGSQPFAVNLSAKECQTAVMPIEDIESLSVSVKQPSIAAAQRPGTPQNSEVQQQMKRHSDFAALESEQKLWRWVLVLLLAVSLVEMGLAGWLTRTPSTFEGQRK
jgi:anti-sigma-K factor RskA